MDAAPESKMLQIFASATPITMLLLLALLASLCWTRGVKKGMRFAMKAQTEGPVAQAARWCSRLVLEPLLAKLPGLPTKIRVSRIGAHAVDLSFKGDASQSRAVTIPIYEIWLKGRNVEAELKRPDAPEEDEDGFWRKAVGAQTSWRLKDLYSDEAYGLKVCAVNGAGKGPWTKEIAFHTRQEASRFAGGIFIPGKHGDRTETAQGAAIYEWSQDASQVCARIALPDHVTRAKHLRVDIQPSGIEVEVRGNEMLLKGALQHPVKPGESTWEIDEPEAVPDHSFTKGSSNLILYLDKVQKDDEQYKARWTGFIKGHPTVDFNFTAQPRR